MSRSFRLTDVLVSGGVAALLLALTVAARRSAQEESVIIGCAGKLGQLAQSLVMYEGIDRGHFPRTRFDPAAPLTAYTAPDAPDPFAATGPRPNDVTASLFLLARVLDLKPEAFTCPQAVRLTLTEEDTFDRQSVQSRSNFRARVNDSYSLANMYPDAAATASGYSLDHFHDRLPPTFVVASDTNPGGESVRTATTQMSRDAIRQANSPNHERDGQNVMGADGSVQFYNAPFVGVNYDNIYTGRGVTDQPKDANDTVLLPTWSQGAARMPAAYADRHWVFGIASVVTLVAIVVVVRKGLKNARLAGNVTRS